MSKFSLMSDLTYEAKDTDEAYLKMAVQMLSFMEKRPIIVLPDGNKIDITKLMADMAGNMLVIHKGDATVFAKDVWNIETMMQ